MSQDRNFQQPLIAAENTTETISWVWHRCLMQLMCFCKTPRFRRRGLWSHRVADSEHSLLAAAPPPSFHNKMWCHTRPPPPSPLPLPSLGGWRGGGGWGGVSVTLAGAELSSATSDWTLWHIRPHKINDVREKTLEFTACYLAGAVMLWVSVNVCLFTQLLYH